MRGSALTPQRTVSEPEALPPSELTRSSAMEPSAFTLQVPEINSALSVKPNASPVAARVNVPPPQPESHVPRQTEPSSGTVAAVRVAVCVKVAVMSLSAGMLTVTPLDCLMLVCRAVKSVIWVASAAGTAAARDPRLVSTWSPCWDGLLIMCRNFATANAFGPVGLDSPVSEFGMTSVTAPPDVAVGFTAPSLTPRAVKVTVSPDANLKVPVASVVHGVLAAPPPAPVLV